MKTKPSLLLICVLTVLIFRLPVVAQESPVADPSTDTIPLATEQNTVQSLEALERSLALKENEFTELQNKLAATTDDFSREDIRKQQLDLRKEIDEQKRQFERFAVDIDLSPFIPQAAPEKFDWQEKVSELLEPIMAEIESATAESRAIGELRGQLNEVGKKRDLASAAVANLDALLKQQTSPELRQRLSARRETWSRTLEDSGNEYMALDLQLQSRLAARESVLDSSTKYVRTFVRTRGLNLLLGMLAFCVVFFGFRFAGRMLFRMRKGSEKKSFGSRLTALLFHLSSILGGLLAMMAVFNLIGDWFMLGIIIIFLIGVAWAGVNTLPQQIETIKLMLNVGAVKEGEVLLCEDIPYRVESLGFSARLVNPHLEGGTRILPVKFLVGQHSRKPGENEKLFPCEIGDWVCLSDGVSGQIETQTPGYVQLVQLGGSRAVYQTKDFLAKRPVNQSTSFRIESHIGIDYRHLPVATTDAPKIMTEKLRAGLAAAVDAGDIVDIRVDFCAAGSSSLDFVATVDLKGNSVKHERDIRFAVQRLLVEACRENNWEIPFTQITVHQAG
jgi:hypothetical protein